jgi:hypothetical protein
MLTEPQLPSPRAIPLHLMRLRPPRKTSNALFPACRSTPVLGRLHLLKELRETEGKGREKSLLPDFPPPPPRVGPEAGGSVVVCAGAG